MENTENIFTKYQKEIQDDTTLDRVILEEKQLKLPALKAKWQARIIHHKNELDILNDLYEDAVDKVATKIETESPIAISRVLARKKAEDHELVKKIQKQIRESTRIIEYLEKIEKTFATMTYDIKNIIDLIKQETG